MDTECILITKDGCFVLGIGSGDSVDLIRTSDSNPLGQKAFCIGVLPESVTTKRLPVYVEDERVYAIMRESWS